jgi:hypothetical protein
MDFALKIDGIDRLGEGLCDKLGKTRASVGTSKRAS